MSGPLGGQRARVFRRRRVKAQDYVDDGHTDTDGCSLQPVSSEEQIAQGLTVTRRWKLFAPAGFRGRAQDELEVTPGPVTDAGAPLRLGFDGPVSPHHDRYGNEHHVEGLLIARDA